MRKRTRTMRNTTLVVVVLSIAVGMAVAASDERTWTRSEVLAITDKKATDLGYSPEHMSVSFDFTNTKWDGYVKGLQNVGGMPNLEEKLKDRKFFAVYYRALKDRTDHEDLWVFLDRSTGEIIDVIPGE